VARSNKTRGGQLVRKSKKESVVDSTNDGFASTDCRGFLKVTGVASGAAVTSTVVSAVTSAPASAKTTINISTWMGFEPDRNEAWESVIGK
jgi:hypothetical protein